MKYKFDGIGMEELKDKFKDKFEDVYTDSDEYSVYETKETFTHCEEGFTYDYKYVINIVCYDKYCTVELYMCPIVSCLKDSIVKELLDLTGLENKEYINAMDYMSYGGFPRLSVDSIEFTDEELESDDLITNDKVLLLMEEATNALSAVDGLYGFYMDKYQNGLGETGWSMTEKLIKE